MKGYVIWDAIVHFYQLSNIELMKVVLFVS